ncbi:hypothetical protein CASFOL_027583 [Castilleja foliolosa]|uniref:MLO-like protein n=1 Tax=Castilleja foliolosa TaxID=1961234 RepID=A0ABD3CGA5_9LAMI
MAAGDSRTLEETPTWAVAAVCFVLVAVSFVIEYIIHRLGKWLVGRNNKALYEALEKVKAELMLLGFISLMLTVGQGPISEICVSKKIGNSWHPCNKNQEKLRYKKKEEVGFNENGQTRKLLFANMDSSGTQRRFLAGGGDDKCAAKGKVPFVSSDGIHQLHIFIFVLAIFHVVCCLITLALSRAKMRKWKAWEKESRTIEYQYSHDPERFRFARDTSFGRRHMSTWSQYPILLWLVCFFRQFVRSVPKVDFLTLRHGFVCAHLAPQSQANFDFQNYIKRTLEQDFKVIVGISSTYLVFRGSILAIQHSWLAILSMATLCPTRWTQLGVIITKMGLRIQERGEVVKGNPIVTPGDDLFWFNRPRFLLYLIRFVFFQNAFQLAFFIWSWYEFGMRSCFNVNVQEMVIRLVMGVMIQILCSYVTLPLYALVTQMGSNLKPTIFNERVAKALRTWHQTARRHIKKNRQTGSGSVTPMSTRPSTPLGSSSPIHLLQFFKSHKSEPVSINCSPITSNRRTEPWQTEQDDISWSHHQITVDEMIEEEEELEEEEETQVPENHLSSQPHQLDREINAADFTFGKGLGV